MGARARECMCAYVSANVSAPARVAYPTCASKHTRERVYESLCVCVCVFVSGCARVLVRTEVGARARVERVQHLQY